MGREEIEVNGRMKKWVGRCWKQYRTFEERLQRRVRVTFCMIDTGHREWL